VGNWLYGVAYRTALEARAARRRVKEQQPVSAVPEPASPEPPEATADLRLVIDEELARLPDKYRSAVVLCDLEGVSRKDAAARLRVPEGTLSSRLAHARKVLAARLTRRGVTASAGLVASTLARDAAATAVPAGTIQLTARAAARFAAGGVVPPGVVSSHVTTLTDGVMKAMIVNRLRLTLGLGVLAAGLLGLGAIGMGQQPAPRSQPKKAETPLRSTGPDTPKAKAPEKVPAKGIEDDDVPYGSFPTQAVVRVEDGKLIVRQRTRASQMVAKEDDEGRKVWVHETRSTVVGSKHDAADVSVFDMNGNRLPDKVWREKLKADKHVLIAYDGKLPLPRELQLFKDDVLLVVLPAHAITSGHGAWGTTTTYELMQGQNGFFYQPRTTVTPPASAPEFPDGPSVNFAPPAAPAVPNVPRPGGAFPAPPAAPGGGS